MPKLDSETLADLNASLTQLRRSPIQYISDCQNSLILTDDDKDTLQTLVTIGNEEASFADQVWDAIEKNGAVPIALNFSLQLARFNYTTLNYYLGEVCSLKKADLEFFKTLKDRYQGSETGALLDAIHNAQIKHSEMLTQLTTPKEADSTEA